MTWEKKATFFRPLSKLKVTQIATFITRLTHKKRRFIRCDKVRRKSCQNAVLTPSERQEKTTFFSDQNASFYLYGVQGQEKSSFLRRCMTSIFGTPRRQKSQKKKNIGWRKTFCAPVSLLFATCLPGELENK